MESGYCRIRSNMCAICTKTEHMDVQKASVSCDRHKSAFKSISRVLQSDFSDVLFTQFHCSDSVRPGLMGLASN